MHGNEYTILDRYQTAIIKLRFRHNKCGYIFKMSPNDFLGGHCCPKCAPYVAAQKLSDTIVTFKKKVYKLVGIKFSVIGKYVNSYTKIKIKHNICGYIFNAIPNHFLYRLHCPKCRMNQLKQKLSKTPSEYKREFYAQVGNEYTLLSTYHSSHTKVKIRHNKCNYVYRVNPNSFIKGHRCPYCYGNYKISNIEFEERIKNLGRGKYITLTKYLNTHTKVKFKHLTCGNYFWMMPSDFTSNGHRCPICFGHKRKTTAEFKDQIRNLVGRKYSVLGRYINGQHKITLRHNVCGCIYKSTPNNFLRGKRCPRCNESHGEHVIERYLIQHHIKYITQKRFQGCVYRHTLPFDFYLPEYHQAIEYDGFQHHHLENFSGVLSKAQ